MSQHKQREFMLKNSFDALPLNYQNNFKLDVSTLDKVFCSQQTSLDISSYVNGRSSQNNLSMIRMALWLYIKNIMDFDEIHRALLSFDAMTKRLNVENLPLSERLISEIQRTDGKVIPPSLFKMWCKRCWSYLESAKV